MTDAPAKGPPCCPIGGRVDAEDLNQRLLSGAESIIGMSRRLGVPYSSVQKHAAKHLGKHAPEQGQTSDNTPENRPENVAPEHRPVLEEARRLQRRASRLLKKLERGDDDVDYKAASGLLGSIHKALELQAKVLGEIKAASTTINVFNSPDYKEFESLLADALVDYPDAADAVMRVIQARRALAAEKHQIH